MTIILAIVFIIMVVMNGALFYVLCSAVSATKKQVSACFVQELEDYNDFLNERKAEERTANSWLSRRRNWRKRFLRWKAFSSP